MATLEELQRQVEMLQQTVDALTTPPTDYYTHRWSGEEIDRGIDRAKEGGALDVALSNKAMSSLGAAGRDLLAWAFEQELTGGFYVDSRITTENHPFPGWWGLGHLVVHGSGSVTIEVTEPFSGRIAVNRTDNAKWMGWQYLSTTTPPQRYVLQLADGWVRVNAAEYWRTQEGLVVVTFRIARSSGAEISAVPHPIATLPEGYRPVGYASHVAASTMSAVPAVLWVGDDGVIYASAAQEVPASSDPNSANWPGFAGTMVFCAN